MENRLWVAPNNDLEAKTIIEMLKRNGEEFLVTKQTWGASWEKLEEEIKTKIEEAQKEEKMIYGVELQGDSKGAINVDHHTYGEDDRSNPKSSIEQVAEILGTELTIDEQFVSANDKGYIPAMEKLGAELGINSDDLQEIIANIRMRDRQMQGVTLEQEAQAQEAVEKLGEITEKKEYIQLDLPHSKTSTVTDRLYGKYNNLLITSEDGETNFYGTTQIIKKLNEKFPGGWSGGQLDQGSGFWGGYADQEEIKKTVSEIVKENEKAKQVLGYTLGSELHEAWRAPRLKEDGTYEPRMKKSKDDKWNAIHGTDDVDIANTAFEDLPSNWQYENLEAGKTAIELVYDKMVSGVEITEKTIEEISSSVHDAWLSRNDWVFDENYGDKILSQPYEKLPEEEKAKDRIQIKKAIEIVEQYQRGEIDIDRVSEKFGLEPEAR